MLTQEKLKVKAVDLADLCKQGKCSLGSALLTLQPQIEQVAKNVTKETGDSSPGSWLPAYVAIRAETNKTFWQSYRTR